MASEEPASLALVLSIQSSLASAMNLVMSILALVGAQFEVLVLVSAVSVTCGFVLATWATRAGRGVPASGAVGKGAQGETKKAR